MEFSTGILFFCLGLAGSITCIVLLCIKEKSWKKQRRKMLKIIEEEEQ